MALLTKNSKSPGFNDVLSLLGSQKFDVAPAQDGAKRTPNAFQVRKLGCAAEIASTSDGKPEILAHPGIVLNGEIARLVDRGYQKFFKTTKLEIPATADHLRSLHEFTEELMEAMGGTVLYNQALGTTSDLYQYDRIKGRK